MKSGAKVRQADLTRIHQDDSGYPSALYEYFGDRAPATLTALGNFDLLDAKMLALFCSAKCPGNLILQTYDLAQDLRDAGATVIGGFHSPMERECLTILLRGTQPVIVCPARRIEGPRLPREYRGPLEDGRLLVISPFDESHKRITEATARARNEMVAALAGKIFIAHAAPGSKTEQLCRDILAWGKPLFTFESADNASLVALGANTMPPNDMSIEATT